MRIACLQFAPQVGDVDNNLNRADAVLSKANPKNLDLLVLPELAFSGYNFRSLQHITPYLEPTASGITSLWARTTALKYDCVVTVGYPEKVDVSPKWPTSPEYYNSAITVNADGETIANYRKSFLYYTDETWALEGADGFFDGQIPGLGNVAMGICKWPTRSFERMDLNPYKFEAPWSAWEFSYHCIHKQANLVIVSMAWLTREDPRAYSRSPKEPDMETLSYWLGRMEPLIRAEIEGEIICVFANRTGTEEEAVYAGTSAVLGIQSGEVKVYGILGRGERELLVVDTNKRPQAKLISEPNSTATDVVPELSPTEFKSTKNPTTFSKSALTLNTKNMSPSLPGLFDDLLSPRTLNEALTPHSGLGLAFPEDYYNVKSSKIEGEYLRENLVSSMSQKSTKSVHPISTNFPTSPKFGRCASPRSAIDQSAHFSPTEPRSPPFSRPFSRGASPTERISSPNIPFSHSNQKSNSNSSAEPSPPLKWSSSRSSQKSSRVVAAEPSPPQSRPSSRSSHKSSYAARAELPPLVTKSSSNTTITPVQVPSAEPSPPSRTSSRMGPEITRVSSPEISAPSRTSSRMGPEIQRISSPEVSPPLDRPVSRVSQKSIQFAEAEPSPPVDRPASRTTLKSCLVKHRSNASVESISSDLPRPTSITSQGSYHSVVSETSSVTNQHYIPALPNSPTFKRPSSPKFRNVSRNRHQEQNVSGMLSHGLTREEQVAFRSAALKPAGKSPELPHTAFMIPINFQSSFAPVDIFGPRTVLPRPTSTHW